MKLLIWLIAASILFFILSIFWNTLYLVFIVCFILMAFTLLYSKAKDNNFVIIVVSCIIGPAIFFYQSLSNKLDNENMSGLLLPFVYALAIYFAYVLFRYIYDKFAR